VVPVERFEFGIKSGVEILAVAIKGGRRSLFSLKTS
jgi:hypothetical protein